MSQPMISVLVPCFNASRWLDETLQSVFDQHYSPLEVIIVDDGSTDDSVARIEPWVAKFERLIVVRQKNRGQTAALNTALEHAQGEFVQYLDADDVLLPGKLQAQLARLQACPNGIAMAAWGRFYDQPANTRFVPQPTWQDMSPVDWLVENWADGGGMMFPGMWLAPMHLVRKVGPWREDLTLLNDTEYFPRLILSASRVLFCPDARVAYRSGLPGSLSGRKTRAGFLSSFQVLIANEHLLLRQEDSERTHRSLSILWQRYAHQCYPYFSALAEEAIRRGKALDEVDIKPESGPLFHLASRLIGWRLARRMQVLAGRQ